MRHTVPAGGVEVTVKLNVSPRPGPGFIEFGTVVCVGATRFRVTGSMPELDESTTFDLEPLDHPGDPS